MKVLVIIFTFIQSFFLSGSNYVTKKDQFLNNVDSAYDKYIIETLDNATGDLMLVIGEVDNKISFSVFYNSNVSKSYNVNIYDSNKDKLFQLSDYDDYQIYYNIALENDSLYYLELKGIRGNYNYSKYEVSTNMYLECDQSDVIDGIGNFDFPYTTKLKNKVPTSSYYIIGVIIFVVVEIVVLIFFIRRRRKMQNINSNYYTSDNTNNYQTLDYVILDKDEENKNEN